MIILRNNVPNDMKPGCNYHMNYCQFFERLFEDGRAIVPPFASLAPSECSAAIELIGQYEATWRSDLPSPIPEFDSAAAGWAAERFFRACQFAVYRDAELSGVQDILQQPLSTPQSASAHYSVDLIFRFLPDLARFVHEAAASDPLHAILMQWAGDWPLSSVGVPGIIITGDLNNIVNHPGLLQLYVDRVMAASDASRLKDDRVRRGVEAATGMYPELTGQLELNASCNFRENTE